MFVHDFKTTHRSLPILMATACFFIGVGSVQALEVYYEDFEDTTLSTGSASAPAVTTQSQGTIANGIISFNDTNTTTTTRHRFVVRPTTAYADPVLTYSFDIREPVVVGSSGTDELRFRAGIGAADNTLQAAEFIYEALLFSNGTNSGAYTNNGNETFFLVANNQNSSLSFTSPIDSSNVTLNAYQYIAYIKNNATNTFGLLKNTSNMIDLNGATDGVGSIARFAIGSSTNAHTGTFAMDNVRLLTGADFTGSAPLLPGDVNNDGFVTIDDFNIIRDNFRKSPRSRSQGDLTSDGLVSLPDFKQWKGAFAGSGASLAGMDLSFLSVPEPSSIVLMLLVVSGMVGCRFRRRVL
jgi:hypothetical protein